jgi:hypothetical protein
MTDPTPLNPAAPANHMFPVLTPAQQARIAAHGRVRQVQAGERGPHAGSPRGVLETLVEADNNGSSHSLDTFRIKEFVTRNGHPYSYVDLDRDAGVQDLLDRLPSFVHQVLNE